MAKCPICETVKNLALQIFADAGLMPQFEIQYCDPVRGASFGRSERLLWTPMDGFYPAGECSNPRLQQIGFFKKRLLHQSQEGRPTQLAGGE